MKRETIVAMIVSIVLLLPAMLTGCANVAPSSTGGVLLVG